MAFQQKVRQNSQNLNNDNFSSFCRPPISNAQCIIGTKKNPYAGIFLNYNDVDYSPGYGQIKEAFEPRTKIIYFNHINLIKFLDLRKVGLMVIAFYMLSIYATKLTSLQLTQLERKNSLTLTEWFLLM